MTPAVVKLGGSTAGAGWLHAQNRGESDRPIPPPYKGEEVFAAALPVETMEGWLPAEVSPDSPPPCGEGLGVGVTARMLGAGAGELDLWIAAFAGATIPLVVVPGGGPFADQVREAQSRLGFSDRAAHAMAMLAMEQFGHVILDRDERFAPARSIGDIEVVLAAGRIPVWMPSELALSAQDIPQSWDVTSDSLAAWLAGRLGAETLLLIKQTDDFSAGDNVAGLSNRGVVDAALPSMLPKTVALRLAGPCDAGAAAKDFASGKLPGTFVPLALNLLRRTA